MLNRSNLSKLYPDVKSKTTIINSEINNPKPMISIGSILLITTQLIFIVTTLIITIHYFEQITFVTEFVIPFSLIWLGLFIAILISISKRLNNNGLNISAFFVPYGFCALPVAQLTFNLYQYFNSGIVNTLPFIGLLVIENLMIVPSILLLISNKKTFQIPKQIWVIILIIFCAFITYLNSIY